MSWSKMVMSLRSPMSRLIQMGTDLRSQHPRAKAVTVVTPPHPDVVMVESEDDDDADKKIIWQLQDRIYQDHPGPSSASTSGKGSNQPYIPKDWSGKQKFQFFMDGDDNFVVESINTMDFLTKIWLPSDDRLMKRMSSRGLKKLREGRWASFIPGT
ncbi:unnamed protein product [Cuscuta europaea]|uniref:Uncharacterized protein n=1 Tax=Cuscuta europaea TaxID=41803 RepID=A0A9P0Z026_CUSEU|nr:unnamed protein product [Cuscuta europaea]